ncbi:MAG: D-alanine--D-alanine ligase [Chloroflexi bacterium]|nr:D-alanine--D-alanine ligase [Chloroflexota bacterium]MQC25637.1 D-alanine--D-alanine ligase [Chloroflexota bacterium]
MTAARQRLGVIFGGRSAEHEVSVVSARGVMREADPERFEVVPVGITKGGAWLTPEETLVRLARVEAGERRDLGDEAGGGVFAYPRVMETLRGVDVVFPIVHGTFGEDGTLQGLLEMADLPYVGPGVAASAVGMDKVLMRAVFAAHDIPQARYLVLRDEETRTPGDETFRAIERTIGYPYFVKPANGGSSVGVGKVRSREDAGTAIAEAGRFDRKVLVEEALTGREVECAVLGNSDPQPSPLGEIRPSTEFYDYSAKYLDDSAALIVPAEVDPDTAARVQALAVQAFQALDCAGLSRVDFFVEPDGGVKCIEVNTLPGFTPISMYPRLWQEAGLSYRDLITRLVELAIQRSEEVRSRA